MNNLPSDVNSDSDKSNDSVLATASGVVTDLFTGASIPAPIRKNAFKAFGQLCTAVVDIPVSHLEGIAAEKRAETQARIKIISTGADQIASQMNVEPEYAHAAVKKYGQKIIREQINLDRVSEAAAQKILQDSAGSNGDSDASQDEVKEAAPINDDWLNDFEREASQKSTEDMQLLFGRILAGEIQRPSSFSIKTVKLLSNLDSEAARLFRRLCSMSVSLRIGHLILDARVVSLTGNAGSNSLQRYGLGFDQLNILQEYGLIIADYNSYFDYQSCIANQENRIGLPLIYINRYWGFLPSPERQKNSEMRLSGVALSRSGRELFDIVDVEPVEEYTVAVQQFFADANLQMLEIPKK